MLQLRIHENLLGVRQEYWDLCFDETNGEFSVLHTNFFDDTKARLPCYDFIHWIAARLRSNGLRSIRTQNNKYLAAFEIGNNSNAAGKGAVNHLCFDDARGIFFVLETVTVITDQGKFVPQENIHQTNSKVAEISYVLWSRLGFVRVTDVVN